ncbi:hypothetical protein COOONC_05533 [Cooperia oncophora]
MVCCYIGVVVSIVLSTRNCLQSPGKNFVDKYLLPNEVKTIIYQPQFEVGNVYLHSATEQLMKKAFLNVLHAAPDKFSRPPDVRFFFQGDSADVEKGYIRAPESHT